MIYLASPYSHRDAAVRRRRFRAACRAAAAMLAKGLMVYSPIVHSTPIAACGLDDMDHDFWMHVDRPYLEWCHMVMVLTLDGWRDSRGVNAEIIANASSASSMLRFAVTSWWKPPSWRPMKRLLPARWRCSARSTARTCAC